MTAARPPNTPTSKIERIPIYTPGRSRIKEEKIFVTVRVRPLSKKELSLKDQEAWACVDDNKIVFKMPAQDRSNSSSSYTFGTFSNYFYLQFIHLAFWICNQNYDL